MIDKNCPKHGLLTEANITVETKVCAGVEKNYYSCKICLDKNVEKWKKQKAKRQASLKPGVVKVCLKHGELTAEQASMKEVELNNGQMSIRVSCKECARESYHKNKEKYDRPDPYAAETTSNKMFPHAHNIKLRVNPEYTPYRYDSRGLC